MFRRVSQFRQRPRLAAMRVDYPDLRGIGVRLCAMARAIAGEGDELSVRRPLRLAIVVAASGELDFLTVGEAGQNQIRDPCVFFFVAGGLYPHQPFRVRRDAGLWLSVFGVDDVFGFPWLGFLRWLLAHDEDGCGEDRNGRSDKARNGSVTHDSLSVSR